tara:strand:+ start:81 stop:731 length:651 start_codon:yes stop_codon:yes gene_type:complete
MPKEGLFIVFEGGEGSGKSTQAELMYNHLRHIGNDVIFTREPGGTPSAEEIRRILLNPEFEYRPETQLFLFEAARFEVFNSLIIPSLDEGKIVLSDRSGYSTLAYQGHGFGIDVDLIKRCNEFATQTTKPNLLFIFDVPARKGLERASTTEFGKQDSFERIGLEFHEKVNKGYLKIVEENPDIAVVIPDTDYEKERAMSQKHEQVKRYFSERLSIC